MAQKEAVKIDGRCEYKYILESGTAAKLREKIGEILSPDPSGGGESYVISSLYFDSPARHLYFQTLDRVPCRYKLRLRVYGTEPHGLSGDQVSFFEIKSKTEGLSTKRRLRLRLSENLRLAEGVIPDTLSPSDMRLAADISRLIRAENLSPAAVVSYERLAFYDPASDLRVTFDSGLRIRTADLSLHSGSYGDPVMGGECVLEVKSSENIPLGITRLIGSFGLRNSSYSKYGRTNFIISKGEPPCLTTSPESPKASAR